MSGHLFFNDCWGGFGDALYANARLCELLSARAPREVFSALPDTVKTPELRLEMEEGERHALVDELAANVYGGLVQSMFLLKFSVTIGCTLIVSALKYRSVNREKVWLM